MNAGITFVGVDTSAELGSSRQHLFELARATLSLDAENQPLLFRGDGPEVRIAVSDAINEIVRAVPVRATIVGHEIGGDDGDALRFIDHLEVNVAGDSCTSSATEDADGDGRDEVFSGVLPGTPRVLGCRCRSQHRSRALHVAARVSSKAPSPRPRLTIG